MQDEETMCLWGKLDGIAVKRVAFFLEPSHVADSLRLVNKATADMLRGQEYTTLHVSSPVSHDTYVRRWGGPDACRGMTRAQREQLMCLTAASGDVANLKIAIASADCQLTPQVLVAAAAAGKWSTAWWLANSNQTAGAFPDTDAFSRDANPIDAAAEAGHEDVCQMLLERESDHDVVELFNLKVQRAMAAAARGGHIALLERLRQRHLNGRRVDPDMLVEAAEGCDLPTLQRVHREWTEDAVRLTYLPGDWFDDRFPISEADLRAQMEELWPSLLAAAARSPTPDWRAKVEWLEGQRGAARAKEACTAAARRADAADRLAWLRQRGYPAVADSLTEAAKLGHVAAVRYLLSEGVRPDSKTAVAAASGGCPEAMAALHAAGCAIDAGAALKTAARGGHLRLVEWLVGTLGAAAQLDDDVFCGAALSNNMELLRWLRERGCWIESSAYWAAAGAGCDTELEWLVEHAALEDDDACDCYMAAIDHVDMFTLRCLRRLDFPWGPRGRVFTHAIRCCRQPLPLLKWLLDEGCPVDWAEATAAARERRSWLDEGPQLREALQVCAWIKVQRESRRRR